MIDYSPLWETMRKKNISGYYLIHNKGFHSHILYRMKQGETITLKTLDTLCEILDCEVQDVIRHVKGKPQK